MAEFTYKRIRKSFFATKGTPESKKADISDEIDGFLNYETTVHGEVIYYNEALIDEGTVHITILFKKEK